MASYANLPWDLRDRDPRDVTSSTGSSPDPTVPSVRMNRNYNRLGVDIHISDEIMAKVQNHEQLLRVLHNQINDQMALSQKQMYQAYPQSYQQRQTNLATHMVLGGGGGGGAGSMGSAGGGGSPGGPGSGGYVLPMGVSEWREHGKRHGYWDYFRDEIRRELNIATSGVEMLFGGSLVTRDRGVDRGIVPLSTKREEPKNKVSITPDITVANKIEIKKHVTIK